jgi:hypothetical protein
MELFPSKEYLERNITVFPMFSTQYFPDFFVAEHYGVRNTTSWGSKDLASECCSAPRILKFQSRKLFNIERFNHVVCYFWSGKIVLLIST